LISDNDDFKAGLEMAKKAEKRAARPAAKQAAPKAAKKAAKKAARKPAAKKAGVNKTAPRTAAPAKARKASTTPQAAAARPTTVKASPFAWNADFASWQALHVQARDAYLTTGRRALATAFGLGRRTLELQKALLVRGLESNRN
jgi:hypothetical protein